MRAPLVEQRSSMYQDQRAAGTGGHQIRANDGLADARRGDENAAVAREKRAGCLILNRRECSDEAQRKRLTGDALVDDIESDTETASSSSRSVLQPRGRATCCGRSSAQEITRGVSAVDSRMLCFL